MSYSVSRREQLITVDAGTPYTMPLACDYIYFHTVPAGISVKLNGESDSAFLQGETHQAEPGSGGIKEVTFINSTGGGLQVRIVFGLGRMTVAGVATLSGSVPLPSGASTAALQTTGNTSLASILSGLSALATNALQTAANALLTTISGLAATTAETPGFAPLGASADQTYTGKKTFAVLNTSTTQDVTLNLNGGSNLTLSPGQSVGWAVKKPLATLAGIRVRTTSTGSANVSFTE